MSVYEPQDYEKVIERIKTKISQLNIEMGKCLTEEEIMSFESRHNVKLPQAYRMFLKYIGNGCKRMLDGCRLNDLECCPQQELSKPFLLEKFWLWEDDERDGDVIEADMQNKVYRGNIELVNWSSNTLSQRSKQLTTVSALYTIAETLAKDKEWNAKVMPLDEEEIEEAYEENASFWEALLYGMDEYQEYIELTKDNKTISELREDNLLMKPVTHMALAHVAYFAKKKGIEWTDVVSRLNQVNWSMNNSVWFNILVIPAKKKKVITGKEAIRAAGMVISYMVMGKSMTVAEVNEVRDIIKNSTNGQSNKMPDMI